MSAADNHHVASRDAACFRSCPAVGARSFCPTVAGESPMQTQPTVSFDGIAVDDLVRSAALTHIDHLERLCRLVELGRKLASYRAVRTQVP
jgi:hypothetical protein